MWMIVRRFCKTWNHQRPHGRISDLFTEILNGEYVSKSIAESAQRETAADWRCRLKACAIHYFKSLQMKHNARFHLKYTDKNISIHLIPCMLDKCETQVHWKEKETRQRHPSCRKHQLWGYKPVLVRLVPSSLKPALSAAATSACAKLPLVKIESSEELPTLDLWLEKLRSSSDAEPHPFTIEPKNKCRGLVSCARLIFFDHLKLKDPFNCSFSTGNPKFIWQSLVQKSSIHLKLKDPLNMSFYNRKHKVYLAELGIKEHDQS